MRFLAVIETQKVKSYLFASPIMRETRGASVLLDLLNRKKTAAILDGMNPSSCERIYLGGGSGRILFKERTDAYRFKDSVIELYSCEAPGARVAVEIVERKVGKDGVENFAEWMARGVAATQQNKLNRVDGIPTIAGRWIRPCSSCGAEPAEEMLTQHGQHQLCQYCIRKRGEAGKLYTKMKRRTEGNTSQRFHWPRLKATADLAYEYTEEFIFTTLSQHNDKDGFYLHLPQDFEDIADYSVPANYIAFIYADGNRMGETVKRLGTNFPDDDSAKLAYRAFSQIVDRATREAAVESVMETLGPGTLTGWNRYIPAEFIMAGGDDLMLVVPAHHGLEVALIFLQKFQEKTIELQHSFIEEGHLPKLFAERGLTTSAGVVIAHAHYPVSDLMKLAADLMKQAKVKSAELAATLGPTKDVDETGTLDFMVVTEAGTETVKDRREREYRVPRYATDGYASLTERPYTTKEAKELLAIIRDLKRSGAPRTKLKSLYSILFQSTMQARFYALQIKERLKATGDLSVSSTLNRLFAGLDRFPFRSNPDGSWTTPLTEIVELYDFIRVEGDEGKAVVKAAVKPEVIDG